MNDGEPSARAADSAAAALLAGIPLFAPAGEARRGRVGSTTVDPRTGAVEKAVVEFGTGEGETDVEIMTRRWTGSAPGADQVRGLCVERDFMQRRMRGDLGARPLPLPEGSAWSAREIEVDGAPRTFTVLHTPFSWVAVAAMPGPLLVRLFASAPRPDLVALRRISAPGELRPVIGRS
ncbi:hypothetical protein [Marinitenerispora sediminis]|uniref:Uncharacterized protein n=1 Tax=Marinitenerispora sediminis TaxID=1931232 RepID=A0A368SZG5_9ACTN|nr:hypothetical protein [Marinitenerispora sediminis]RCV48119.1 hypothetical protein DEF28_24430 [Marinitenerispora sediminis]RCV51074.1 hypothetical protein DEF24_23560 [Marinitenerispora sediminis]RCV60742.1 hypothetical protein DEF23_04055 [Marinitenerispora sediminis]